MSFYDTREELAELFKQYAEDKMLRAGYTVKKLVDLHKSLKDSLNAQHGEYYSAAVLYSGVPVKEAPLFANIPHAYFAMMYKDKLEQIFTGLRVPATQCSAVNIARKAKRNGILSVFTADQLDRALFDTSIIGNLVERSDQWCREAVEALEIMTNNLPLVHKITDEEKEFAMLLNFDWHYDYSDDSSVWRSGLEKHRKVVAAVNAALEKNPELNKVLAAITKKNNLGAEFFTKKV